MAAAFIQAKKNAQRNFKQAITAQEDGMEQYRHDNFQKATSFRRPLQPPPRTDTNLSDENDPHAAGCEKSATAGRRRGLAPNPQGSFASAAANAWLGKVLRGADWGDSGSQVAESLQSAETEAGVDFGVTRYTGLLKKLVTAADIRWLDRQVTITDSAVVFQRVTDDDFSSGKIMDSIDLLEIVQCSKANIDGLSSPASNMTAIGVKQTSFHHVANATQSSNAVSPGHLRSSRFSFKSRSMSTNQATNLRSEFDEIARPTVGLVGAVEQKRRHASTSSTTSPRAQWLLQEGGGSDKDLGQDSIHDITSNVPSHMIEISTYPEGYNSGRVYRLAADTQDAMDEWLTQLQSALSDARARHEMQSRKSRLSRFLSTTKNLYDSNAMQRFVGLLILVNFSLSIWEAETRHVSSDYDTTVFDALEIAFTAIFCVEILFNLIASGPFAFLQDNWNLMDLGVILVSIIAIILKDKPGFSLLRLVRAFRVIRLVRRLSSLRRIVNALASSVVPMCSAFSVLFLVSSIYSVIGVDLFGAKDAAYFGTYSASLFTMFQVCTFDDWSDVARDESGNVDFQTAAFFISFVVVVGWIILNVVVAVLLDEFVETVTKDRNAEIEKDLEKEKQKQRSFGSPIDPLLAVLSCFTTSADLSDRIKKVFELLDPEGVGAVGYEDLRYGLRKLSFSPPIHLSFDDFQTMVRDHGGASGASSSILDGKGRMDLRGFEILISEQLRHHVQRRTAQAMQGAAASGSSIGHVLFVLKLISTNLDNLSTTVDRVDSRVDKLEATLAHRVDVGVHASNPIKFDQIRQVSSPVVFDRLSSSAGDGAVASPNVADAPSTSAHVSASAGTSVDIALHCKMDKLINMVANLTSILTPTGVVAVLSSVASGARADGKLSPKNPASNQGDAYSPSLHMRGGAAMRQFAGSADTAAAAPPSRTARSIATTASAAWSSKAISGNESGALDEAAAASALMAVTANRVVEMRHLTMPQRQYAEASISQQPISVLESLQRQDETQGDSGRSHHKDVTQGSSPLNPLSERAHTAISSCSVGFESRESSQQAATSPSVESGPVSALGGSAARRPGRTLMNPALESKLENLKQVQSHDDGGAVLGMLVQPEKASERVKDRVLKVATPRAPTGADAKGSRSLQRQERENQDEGQGQGPSWREETQDRDASIDSDSDRDTGRSRHDTTQQHLKTPLYPSTVPPPQDSLALRYLTLQGSCSLGDLPSPVHPHLATFAGLTLDAEPQINSSPHSPPSRSATFTGLTFGAAREG